MKNFNFEQPYVGFNAIILDEQKHVLMVKEADGPHKNKWNFPGGRWDQKETPVEGVSREVKEETGYDFKPTGVVGFYSKFRERPSFTVVALQVLFTGDISGEQGTLAPDIAEIKYFSADQIYSMEESELFDMQYKEALKKFFSAGCYPLDILSHGESLEPDFE